MVEPLCSLLGPDGLIQFGQQILNRKPIDPDLPITEGAQLLLENQYNKISKLCNTEHTLKFELLMKGLKKWPERMATSRSGRHLGVYKWLLKDQHHKKQGEPITTKGIDIMMEIYWLLTLAIKHTHLCTHLSDGRQYGICIWKKTLDNRALKDSVPYT